MLWQGAIVDIPKQWVLCDGQNDTPDLRDQMVIGSNGIYAIDDTGGVDTHDHSFTSDTHSHSIRVGTQIQPISGKVLTTALAASAGLSVVSPSLPPYYSLAYIMFIGN